VNQKCAGEKRCNDAEENAWDTRDTNTNQMQDVSKIRCSRLTV